MQDQKLKAYLPIIESSLVYPVLFDARRTVLSLPPIINGAHSAISLATRNVFIECTATDLTKAGIVLNQLVTAFAHYCAQPFSVEAVEVVDAMGVATLYPDLRVRELPVEMSYVRRCTGLDVSAERAAELLLRMQLSAAVQEGGERLLARVPPTRPDVLHAADVMEDVAIAYGFNNIQRSVPTTVTVATAQPLNTLSDLLRLEVAMAGFTEVLTWVLCAAADNHQALGLPDDGVAAVVANPASTDVQAVRSSLLPGALRTLGHNKDAALPVKLFELGDVVLLDAESDVGARNVRRLLVLTCGTRAGFEVVHGLLDRLMEVLAVPASLEGGYHTLAAEPQQGGPWFLGRVADVLLRGCPVGRMGVIHPDIAAGFDVSHPVSALELDIEPFL
jgi:phenylalanyl-tRNA synthetase beta chain